ncbi:MAG: bifunctional phosphoribosylaminoimidazolecarboxamide formyltransferase/IMP cyclohydrolase [Bacteroidota bacterium]|nr:bifunctional phosphoribosylaminoimidazolecarboxamide formyltransferase/IMP cyclohydrolase [Bacteroidota bacterium]
MRIRSALISVYHKTGLEKILPAMQELGITIYSTGGTYDYLFQNGIEAIKIEDVTSYPGILGGRVKTLHPKVFGGILGRRHEPADIAEMESYSIPSFDLVIVDLYPFSKTVADNASHEDIIEKIDVGGVSLIRAAAKNHKDVVVIPSCEQYSELERLLIKNGGESSKEDRAKLAAQAFVISSSYDQAIAEYFLKQGEHDNKKALRYGENPHQNAQYLGDLDKVFGQLHGKDLSYNNIVDIDAALALIQDLDKTAFAIIKHTNPCGVAVAPDIYTAWVNALQGDPVSAFGGVLATNGTIDIPTAQAINDIFFEVILAPSYTEEALTILRSKKNRIILKVNKWHRPLQIERTALNGKLVQDSDTKTETEADLKTVTQAKMNSGHTDDLLFANVIVKHAKSNAIVLAKNMQLIGIGIGQTSRIDALQQAIDKAKSFNFDLNGAVLASDAFFPFPDCVKVAYEAGITSIIQPGGSIRDQESIDACNFHGISMVLTGYRHFKH